MKEDPVAALLVRSAELEGGREVRTRGGVRVVMDAAERKLMGRGGKDEAAKAARAAEISAAWAGR